METMLNFMMNQKPNPSLIIKFIPFMWQNHN